eukprot:gene26088-31503_t
MEMSLPDQLDLDQITLVERFLNTYANFNGKLKGVFALESEEGQVHVVDYCNEDLVQRVRDTVSNFQEGTFSTIRVQTFKDAKLDFIQAYTAELCRQTQPDLRPLPHTSATNVNNLVLKPSSPGEASHSSKVVEFSEDVRKAALAEAVKSPFVDDLPSHTPSSSSLPNLIPGANPLELTVVNIEKVLDEVRPYLIADGGNVAVARVDQQTRSVYLVLEGACGSCPSSTTTMRMGIERILRENFADLGEIAAVDPKSLQSGLTKDSVLQSLEKLLPAIQSMGGKIDIVDVEESTGMVKVGFAGPARLKKGVELVLKDNELIKQVVFEDAV